MSAAVDCCVSPQGEVESTDVIIDQNANKMDQKEDSPEVESKDPRCNKSNEEPLPSLEIPSLGDTSRSSTPSEGNTPRDYDTSSSSPSPVPEDGSEAPPRPKINLGRDISLMMKALNSLHSPEEKIAALCKKYADLLEQQKMKEKRMRGMERKSTQVAKEKEQLQKDLSKAVLGQSKMENLARELNRQNKQLKEETYNLSITHSKEREQVSVKFQAATDEISGKINSIAKRNEVLTEENHVMSEKFEKLVAETISRDKMVKAMFEQRDLKEQILVLKAKKAEEEREVALMDQLAMKKEIEKSNAMCEGYLKQEKELRTQITYYSDRVSDFQTTLDKSNKMFSAFRKEMDAMNRKMKDLEKATATWKKNFEESQVENKRILEQNLEQARTINQLNIKQTRLTNLSRALQAERNEFAKTARMAQQKETTVKAEATSTIKETSGVNGVLNPIQQANTNASPHSTEVTTPASTEDASVSSSEDSNHPPEPFEAETHSCISDDPMQGQGSSDDPTQGSPDALMEGQGTSSSDDPMQGQGSADDPIKGQSSILPEPISMNDGSSQTSSGTTEDEVQQPVTSSATQYAEASSTTIDGTEAPVHDGATNVQDESVSSSENIY